MGSSHMDTTNGKEIVVKANIRETPKTNKRNRALFFFIFFENPVEYQCSTNESIQNKVYRDSNYDFSNEATMKRMRDNNKDFDFVMESPFSQPSSLSRVEESPNHGVLTPREVRVSFNENLADNRIGSPLVQFEY
ncbi:hypothetical protein H5410_001865 [Solanum commersonii]|uniref:Uncharacterized protein n=1 Tax=Solanum commersonii TaxID=4109 RepID=A0A9J6B0F0_SOLCO|nr:hypothetical protein H5410_001865 [Solanum commersonii]